MQEDFNPDMLSNFLQLMQRSSQGLMQEGDTLPTFPPSPPSTAVSMGAGSLEEERIEG